MDSRGVALLANLSGKETSPTGVDGHAMDSYRYEDELNGAIVLAFAYALSVFLDNYNVAALYNFTCPMPIPGVFTMPAPGRVSYRNPRFHLQLACFSVG